MKDEKKYTLFHQAKDFLNEHYDIKENIINNNFYIRSKADANNKYELLNENDLFLEIQESGIKLGMDNLFIILKSSFTPKSNPIQEYFEYLPQWDTQTDYIKQFTSYIKTIHDDWFYSQLKKWMVRVIKCILNDKYFNKQALIFAQQGQNSGKTTLCRFLCPNELTEYKKEHMDNLTSKDTKIELARNFLINLDELAVMNNQEDIKKLKSFMTTDFINERLPYGKSNVTLPRRCSFIGSTDNFDFLKDKTGNVRWLVIELENIEKPINFEYSKLNIDDLWAQAYYLSKDSSFSEQMTNAELKQNEFHNEKYFIPDIETEIIMKELKPGKKGVDEFMTASNILQYIKEINNAEYYSLLRNSNVVKIGRILSQLKFIKEHGTNSNENINGVRYGYYVKKLNNPYL